MFSFILFFYFLFFLPIFIQKNVDDLINSTVNLRKKYITNVQENEIKHFLLLFDLNSCRKFGENL
jgi:hypothetical protein